ncbi:MAG: vitamin K epoxide reductase family protein [Chloroflexota bacterium]|nr:vitamin K epoxide reductase family protein [Chloroflexota bacterium]
MRRAKAQVLARPGGLSTGGRLRWGGLSVLAVAGMGVAAYLTYTHWADKPVACGNLGDCNLVQTSEYSAIAGVPVALLGFLLCAALLGVVVWRVGPDRSGMAAEWAPVAVFSMTLMGVAYAAYLTYVELFVLEAICIYCVALASIITASWLISLAELFA